MPSLENGHRITAIITPAGQDKVKGRVIWDLGDPSQCYGYMIGGMDMKIIAEQVNDLVRLIVLYRSIAEHAQRSELTRMDAQQLDRSLHAGYRKTVRKPPCSGLKD